jgi:hypothetical protein
MSTGRIFRVMLSGTFIDLEDKCREVILLMGSHDLHEVAMDNHAAKPTVGTNALPRQMVDAADAYIGIIGYRYGGRVPSDNLPLTELEWRHAKERGIPRCVLLMSSRYPVPAEDWLALSVRAQEHGGLAHLRTASASHDQTKENT